MRLNPKLPAHFTVAQAFRSHCFDYLYVEFRTVSSIRYSFGHSHPFFYFCLSLGVQFTLSIIVKM